MHPFLRNSLFLALLGFNSQLVRAQTGVGIGTLTPDASAALDISSLSKGVLLPRVVLTGPTDATTIPNPATGLAVFNATTVGALLPGIVSNVGTPASPIWEASGSKASWLLTGNSGTIPTRSFLGTTDNRQLALRVNDRQVAAFRPGGAFWVGDTTAQFNQLIGYKAGSSITTGTQNIFLGPLAGQNNTAGSFNLFFGYRAGATNTDGGNNVYFGYQAGVTNTRGSNNTFIGGSAGTSNTLGGTNVFLGSLAGYSNTEASDNVYIGSAAGFANTRGANNVFSGAQAGFNNTTGGINTNLGYNAGSASTTGSGNTSIGGSSGLRQTTGSFNTFLGFGSGLANSTQHTNATALGYRAFVDADNALVLGGTGANAVKVGIGMTVPTEALHVQGNILASGTITQNSDRRLKTNVRPLSGALAGVDQLRPVRYTFLPGKGPEGEQLGVIAQEIEQVYPELVRTDKVTGIKSVNYIQLTPVLLAALQELQRNLNAATSELQTLRQREETTSASLVELSKRLSALEGGQTSASTVR